MARQMVRIKSEKVIKEDDASVVLRLKWQDEVKDETLPKGVIRRYSELEFDVETWFLDLFKMRKYTGIGGITASNKGWPIGLAGKWLIIQSKHWC
jgi:hypothetical protein